MENVTSGARDEHDATLRNELAKLIRDNMTTISARLERKFVEEYPGAKANGLDADLIHRWTIMELETIACALERNNPSIAVHQGNFGEIVTDYDEDVSHLASSLASTLFMARHIAPLVFCLADTTTDATKSQRMVVALEELIRDILAAYCDQFNNALSAAGSIAKKWDMLSGLESDLHPEVTPAKKHKQVKPQEGSGARGLAPLWEGDLLTGREKDILEQLITGKSNGEIAQTLNISQNTVKNHVARIFDKLGVSSRAELLAEVLS